MDNQQLANQIRSLEETMESLIKEIQNLRDDLETAKENDEKMKFRMSELEDALNRN